MKRGYLFLVLFLLGAYLSAQDLGTRGLQTAVNQLTGQSTVVGRQYVVLIAIDRYQNWNALRNPVRDAREIKEILTRRYFVDEFIELYDEEATKAGIVRLFDRLIFITKPEDSVFIFYAGHGHLDKLSDTGFWVPVDGGLDRYQQLNWLPNMQIRGLIRNLKARHVVLLSDSCFSGDILNPTRAISPEITDESIRKAYARVSRQVLTSGASESVPDESTFARGLKLALEGSYSPYLDPLILYNEIRLGVRGTTPLLGDLKDSGHQEGASFVLFLKDKAPRVAAEQSEDGQSFQPSFKLEKTYGTLKVEAKTAGRLFLDGVFQGKLPVGSVATLENVEAGQHDLSIEYDTVNNGGSESPHNEVKLVTVERDTVVEIAFTFVERTAEAAATLPKTPSADEGAPQKVKSLASGSTIPAATIKIDGKYEDWEGVPPAFIDELSDHSNMDIATVYLAKDSRFLYVKFDIADATPTTWLRPHNFDTSHDNSEYGLHFVVGAHELETNVVYSIHPNRRWEVRIDYVSGEPEIQFERPGSRRMKDSSFEVRFPMAVLTKYMQLDEFYEVFAKSFYQDDNGKWVSGDFTDTKTLRF